MDWALRRKENAQSQFLCGHVSQPSITAHTCLPLCTKRPIEMRLRPAMGGNGSLDNAGSERQESMTDVTENYTKLSKRLTGNSQKLWASVEF